MEAHSRLAPSSANQWVYCPLSVVAQEQHPQQEDKESAIDGNTAHWLSALLLNDQEQPSDSGKVITEEIEEAVNDYVCAVTDTVTDSNPILYVEHQVPIHLVHPECFGTMDTAWFDHKTSILHIFDLKFGWGIVEVFRNFQMILYALGMVDNIQFDKVHFHIVQPRPYHPEGTHRIWEVTREELLDFIPQLQKAAFEALGLDPQAVTGSHCRYCSALYACPSAEKAALYAIDVTGGSDAPTPNPAQIGYRLTVLRRAAEAINHLLSATEQAALSLGSIPGWETVFAAGRKNWDTSRSDEIRLMADMYKVTVDKEPALITPTQAVKAGLPVEIVDMYSRKSTGKAKLKPINQDKIKQLLK